MKNLLSDHSITVYFFDEAPAVLKNLKESKETPLQKRSEEASLALLKLIQKEKEPCFLLAAVLDFIRQVDEQEIVHPYTFSCFELWLNQHSGLSFEENLHIRAKIVGKRIERGDYQTLFPIGMGKVYEGSHFVSAHKSPDLDTTIASFWGWMDAFGARVSEGLHIWNLPEGPPASQIEIEWIFRDLFGEAVFTHLPKTRTFLSLSANDLMTQKGLQKKGLDFLITQIEHDPAISSVIAVDDAGFFLGDWRVSDVEGISQVIVQLASFVRWFENALQVRLISLFSKPKLHFDQIQKGLKDLLLMTMKESEPYSDLLPKQRELVESFSQKVLNMKKGLSSTFEDLAETLSVLGGVSFGGVESLLQKMRDAKLFTEKGELVEKRPPLFAFLKDTMESLHKAILKIRSKMETLEIALKTKYEVFERRSSVVTTRADVEEILSKISHHTYLTVVQPDQDLLYPVGVIHETTLRKPVLGTVSLRDFSSKEEMGIAPYLDVISIVDHHKSSLTTTSPAVCIVADVQSSNTLVAQKAFEINDANRQKPNYIHPEREYIEYLHFLYGIIDDTDLLSKVSLLDVQCVASLLNRLKSLAVGKKLTIIDAEDLPRNEHYPKRMAERILQNEDMYSLYRKVFEFREKEVEKNLTLCAGGKESNLFSDTKEQNRCCRVGQTKIFAANIAHFQTHARDIQKVWLQKAEKIRREREEIDFHMHMMSTIVSAEEVFRNQKTSYKHQDELWIWIPPTELAVEHLKRFLTAFQNCTALQNNPLEVELLGENSEELMLVFKESFLEVPFKKVPKKLPMAVLKYKAGSLNSRKAMISPYLPSSK